VFDLEQDVAGFGDPRHRDLGDLDGVRRPQNDRPHRVSH
jgi:hypothetical protein